MSYTRPAAVLAALALVGLAATSADAASLRIALSGQTAPGNLDIYTVAPNGDGRQKVTSGQADDTLPYFSPARDQIVFTRKPPSGPRRLFMVRPSGANVHVLPNTTDGGAPSWSPDGALIAFGAAGDGIHTIKPDGTGGKQLTDGASDANPTWSPDSARIAFERGGEIWRMDADGTNLKRLTKKGAQPAWRPNGKNIAFVRKTNRGGAGKSLAVFLMEPDGSHVAQLTLKGGGAAEKDRRPAWEPNSRHVAYGATAGGGSKIRTMLIGGATAATPENVTPGSTPAW
ncbi:MAG TPA: hypothetical protein VJT75_09075 [Thermoleophilaceae bacterium]|nr:hypothetical protein [Thermoleophilaceae bacterium]